MAILFAEGAVKRVRDYLEEALPGVLEEVNTQWGDTPFLAMPTTYDLAEWSQMPQTPCVLILCDDSEIQNESAGMALNSRHSITIVVVERDQNQEDLRIKIYRYVAALIQCLQTRAGRIAVGMVGWRKPVSSYAPIYTAPNLPYETDAQVRFDVLMQETP